MAVSISNSMETLLWPLVKAFFPWGLTAQGYRDEYLEHFKWVNRYSCEKRYFQPLVPRPLCPAYGRNSTTHFSMIQSIYCIQPDSTPTLQFFLLAGSVTIFRTLFHYSIRVLDNEIFGKLNKCYGLKPFATFLVQKQYLCSALWW